MPLLTNFFGFLNPKSVSTSSGEGGGEIGRNVSPASPPNVDEASFKLQQRQRQQTLIFSVLLVGNLTLIGCLLLIWKIYGVTNVRSRTYRNLRNSLLGKHFTRLISGRVVGIVKFNLYSVKPFVV